LRATVERLQSELARAATEVRSVRDEAMRRQTASVEHAETLQRRTDLAEKALASEAEKARAASEAAARLEHAVAEAEKGRRRAEEAARVATRDGERGRATAASSVEQQARLEAEVRAGLCMQLSWAHK
jgi:hypothetical protein